MPVAYVLRHPARQTLTLTLDDRSLIMAIGSVDPTPLAQTFASAPAARAHLERVMLVRRHEGYILMETREVAAKPLAEILSHGVAIGIDRATNRLTIRFLDSFEVPKRWYGVGTPLPAEAAQMIASRLSAEKPCCLQVICDPLSPGSQLAALLDPSLEAFIFDTYWATHSRQMYNTLGDISDVLEACPSMQRAFISGCSVMRKTQHAHLRELYLVGHPLDSSIFPALAASQMPALETLVLGGACGEDMPAGGLVAAMRSIEAPRLSHIWIDGAGVLDLLDAAGAATLPWNLTLYDRGFDDVESLMAVIDQYEALRSPRLRLDFGDILFDDEKAQIGRRGIGIEEDARDRFLPQAYSGW